MPPAGQDGPPNADPTKYRNVSTFTTVDNGLGVMRYGDKSVRFPLNPFMGMMGVAFSQDSNLTAPSSNSIPPTLGGGNIDIRLLGVGPTFYLPVFAEGALFYAGDPHLAMGNGEVALTAMEGSLRGTFRLTVCKPGSGDAPSVAYRYPFAENADLWVPIGLSDPDGSVNGQINDLNVAMRRAVVNALDFLEFDKGMDRATASLTWPRRPTSPSPGWSTGPWGCTDRSPSRTSSDFCDHRDGMQANHHVGHTDWRNDREVAALRNASSRWSRSAAAATSSAKG